MKTQVKFLALTAMLLAGGLTGCERGDGKVHVKFWHTMGQANQDILERMINEFQANNPDVVIEAYSQGGYDDIAKKINDAIPAGTTPTMAFCYPDNVASYLTAGAIEDMSSYVNNEEYGFTAEEKGKDDFVASYWNEGENYQQTGLYSLPYARSTEAIFYNATVFEENGWTIPTTWEGMWALCAAIKTRYPTQIDYPLGYDSDSNLFITFCEQNNIPYTTKNGNKPEDHFLFVNDQAKAMVQSLKEKYTSGLFVTKGCRSNSEYTSTAFTSGKILMSIGSTGGTTYNKSLNFDVGVAPIPGTSLNRHVITQGPSVCFFKRASSAEKIAAWKFYKHITSTENSASFSIRTGYEPVRTSSLNTESYLAYLAQGGENYITRTGGNLLASAANCTKDNYVGQYFSSDVFAGSDTARDEVGGIIANYFLGTKDLNTAFDDALTNCLFAS